MGQLLLSAILGFGVIVSAVAGASSREEDVPMRMAEDKMVVPEYSGGPEDARKMTLATGDEAEYQVYQGVMGRPGVDFPVHQHIPATQFSCRTIKRSGYYADLETDCQVFHICDGGRKISFLCPNGTIFRQSHLICDWWFRVDCGKSVELYEESAEQLAADQQIYKARSDEREKKKKQVLANHGEDSIVGLDEPYRATSAERKSERHSKKVVNADFSNLYPGRQGRTSSEVVVSNEKPTPTGQSPSTFNPRARNPSNNYYESFQQSASGSLVNSLNTFNQRTQHVFAVDKSLFLPSTTTTLAPTPRETSNFEFESHRTTLPTTPPPRHYQPREQNLSSRSRTAFAKHEESERQHFAESASFASHRGGRTFADFNHPNLLLNGVQSVTTNQPYTTPAGNKIAIGSKSIEPDSQEEKTHKLKKTIDRLKYVPFSSTSSLYKPTVPYLRAASTTPMPPQTRTPIENVYFTTSRPESSSTATYDSTRISTFYPTFESTKILPSTAKPELDVSLQELNIQRTSTVPVPTTKMFEETRDGLQVPPSAGPSALRSFALYFAGTDEDRDKKLSFLPENVLIIPIRKPDRKSTDVVEQVDQVVKSSNVTVQPAVVSSADGTLPNSLTSQTQNSFNELFKSQVKHEETSTTTEQIPDMIDLINRIQNNDLYSSQSRGIAEPDPKRNQIDDKYSKIAPDLRELAQVFTKALSAYLDDPEGFRKALSQIRPTEPTPKPVEYSSATKEEDEVLDFSDVTKPPKRSSTEIYTEATTEYVTETTVRPTEISNNVLPLSNGLNVSETRYRVPEIELLAPFETLDESQSSYYTPSPNEVGTTNAIADEINKEFSASLLPEISSNEAEDSYRPVLGSVDDQTRPRYGGFQNNTKYSPYGSELKTTTVAETKATTYKPLNHTSELFRRLKEEDERLAQEAELVRAVNALVTRPTPLPLSVISERAKLLRQETRTTPDNHRAKHGPTRSTTQRPSLTTVSPSAAEPNPIEINLELSPPAETEPPQGFFVTYSIPNSVSTVESDYITSTTEIPTEKTTLPVETVPPTTEQVRPTQVLTTTTTYKPLTTPKSRRRGKTGKSLERLTELQETLMFNTSRVTPVEKMKARQMVEQTMSNMTMTDKTASTLTMMMEMAAKNETYRRLVLLLVNDRSGRNKSIEEARISLLRALLTPVISHGKLQSPFVEELTPAPRKSSPRRGKYIQIEEETMPSTQRMRVTTSSPEIIYSRTTARPRIVKTTTQKPSTVIGNLGLIRKTIEESKTKEIKVNSLDDAVLDSDARAVELLRSLYSLAARWG